MQKKFVALVLMTSVQLFAQNSAITLIKQSSPEFLLGKETHINMKFVPEDAHDMWLRAGVRVQGTMAHKRTEYTDVSKTDTNLMDAYLRRVRLEIAAGFGAHSAFMMDIRNDKSNYGLDNDEGHFTLGDAYVKIKKPFGNSLINFKLYRAKIEVSRTETVKSARLICYDRPFVADQAAQYISLNRRGTNLQMYGHWKQKVHYQIAFGAATNPDKLIDAKGAKGKQITLTDQSFFYGGKVWFSPFEGWEERSRTETYMGEGKHFTFGIAYWRVPTLKGNNANGIDFNLDRELLNIELSGHYNGFFAQAEYFKFDNMIKAWQSATALQTGTSEGWYLVSEYLLTDLYYLAPFMRYEKWDRWQDAAGYDLTSTTVGINWYLRGNTIKIGANYQENRYGENIGDKKEKLFRLTSQWFF